MTGPRRVAKLRTMLLSALLAVLAVPSFANNIITAEQPPIAPRGWTLQFDNRPTYVRSKAFVARDGTETSQSVTSRQFLAIVRLYTKRWMLRASAPVVSQTQNAKGRYGVGDLFLEAGALYNPGPWRLRFLGFGKAPTGKFDLRQAVNIGGGQWDFGPSLYVTRYLDEKRVDLDLQTQYAFRTPNTTSGVKPGNELTYNVAAARQFELGVPVRLGVEHRGFFGEPNTRDGRAVGGARRSLAVGPVAMLNMGRFVKGFTLWPTMIFDVHNRNTNRTQLYYLKIQFNY